MFCGSGLSGLGNTRKCSGQRQGRTLGPDVMKQTRGNVLMNVRVESEWGTPCTRVHAP